MPGVSSPSTPLSYDDIIQLIDVQRPYYALFDMAQLAKAKKPTVRGYFLKESRRHEENGDPISGSELGRHSAIMGSVACALANPMKEKHYYLAFGAKSERIEGGGKPLLWRSPFWKAWMIQAARRTLRPRGSPSELAQLDASCMTIVWVIIVATCARALFVQPLVTGWNGGFDRKCRNLLRAVKHLWRATIGETGLIEVCLSISVMLRQVADLFLETSRASLSWHFQYFVGSMHGRMNISCCLYHYKNEHVQQLLPLNR